jgi:hypothetical protein
MGHPAVRSGLSLLRRDEWADQIAPGTPIEIAVCEPATTHTASLVQICRRCGRRLSICIAISPLVSKWWGVSVLDEFKKATPFTQSRTT